MRDLDEILDRHQEQEQEQVAEPTMIECSSVDPLLQLRQDCINCTAFGDPKLGGTWSPVSWQIHTSIGHIGPTHLEITFRAAANSMAVPNDHYGSPYMMAPLLHELTRRGLRVVSWCFTQQDDGRSIDCVLQITVTRQHP